MSEISIYEVIADYPSSLLSVGDKVTVLRNTGMAYLVEDHDSEDVRDYPHIFKEVDHNS